MIALKSLKLHDHLIIDNHRTRQGPAGSALQVASVTKVGRKYLHVQLITTAYRFWVVDIESGKAQNTDGPDTTWNHKATGHGYHGRALARAVVVDDEVVVELEALEGDHGASCERRGLFLRAGSKVARRHWPLATTSWYL